LWSCFLSQELGNYWWKEQTCISGVAWPEGMKEHLLVMLTLPGTFLVLAGTVHMLYDRGTLKDYLIGVELSTSMRLFYSDIL
jgi:hypothetical protein